MNMIILSFLLFLSIAINNWHITIYNKCCLCMSYRTLSNYFMYRMKKRIKSYQWIWNYSM
jgi:hypothetical protein